ncbi:P-type conjugative transfer protein VirB9 [Rickettsiales endosymbiont of Stachyamoeba lipophora]|uniref:P-type conjugative transfer protein VirB9 n=1 Tax=Rickettsiales endosymbiont of Stachyamoeba lipophora TaxID=2486578 RepID=UPI000F64A066|nr:P-type conjugative transfer protein VirB9 [Rickettsiales endosymbiont of Stachyamoeba lipophora]AZL15618.1 P-type conjugative transfer protein VirB9 [Rickettsiales endosymbiont of Stachyamoeba lipophora]
MKIFLVALMFFSLTNNSWGLREPRAMPIDSRLRVLVYNPEDVFKFIGFYGYQASMEFDDTEVIESISMGDSIAWQVVPSGKRLFLKPVEPNATTNMTLITNKRVYHFELHAKDAIDINDPEMIFNVKFIYPDEDFNANIKNYASSSQLPDLDHPEKLNFNYTLSGADSISPIKIFDDGEFTYFEFRDKNAEIPAFFLIDSTGKEALINYRVAGKYIVIERVASQFTLRNGADIVCIFNEVRPIDNELLNKPSQLNASKRIDK